MAGRWRSAESRGAFGRGREEMRRSRNVRSRSSNKNLSIKAKREARRGKWPARILFLIDECHERMCSRQFGMLQAAWSARVALFVVVGSVPIGPFSCAWNVSRSGRHHLTRWQCCCLHLLILITNFRVACC